MSHLATEYEQDFHAWVQQHIALLKQGKVNEIDVEHLILELEDMGKSNIRELESRLIVLIAHLLKWQFQLRQLSERWQEFDGRSWRKTIIEQRTQLSRLLRKVPSLKRELQNSIEDVFPDAVKMAAKETKLPPSIFPNECLYTIEQLLDDDFYP